MKDLQIDLSKVYVISVDIGTAATLESKKLEASTEMEGKDVYAVCVLTDANLLLRDGSTPVGAGGLPSIDLTIYEKGNNNTTLVDRYPTQLLQADNVTTTKGWTLLEGSRVDWQVSKITKLASTGLSDNEVFLLACAYR